MDDVIKRAVEAAREWHAARLDACRLGSAATPEHWSRLGAAETALATVIRTMERDPQ